MGLKRDNAQTGCAPNVHEEVVLTSGVAHSSAPSSSPLSRAVCVCVLPLRLLSHALCVCVCSQRLRREQPAPGTQHHGLLQQQLAAYPGNLTLANMSYFLCAPTLCYQTDYPRSTRFRKRWFLRRCMELLVCGARSTVLPQPLRSKTGEKRAEGLGEGRLSGQGG
jgi:hypothetical protein